MNIKKMSILALLLAAPLVLAQSGGGYDLKWNTQDAGGTKMSAVIGVGGRTFSIVGTVGQADASGAQTGGTYTLRGGFQQTDSIFKSGFGSDPPTSAAPLNYEKF